MLCICFVWGYAHSLLPASILQIIVRDLGVVGYTSISAAVLRSPTKRNEVYAAMHFVASVVTRRDRPTRRPSSSELREREARWQGVGVDVRVPSEADLRMETRLNEQQQHTRNAQRRRRAPTVAELRARERNWQPVVAVQEDNEEKMVEPERERSHTHSRLLRAVCARAPHMHARASARCSRCAPSLLPRPPARH